MEGRAGRLYVSSTTFDRDAWTFCYYPHLEGLTMFQKGTVPSLTGSETITVGMCWA